MNKYYFTNVPVFVVSSFSGSMSELHSISFISVHYNIIIERTGLFLGPVRSGFSTGPHFFSKFVKSLGVVCFLMCFLGVNFSVFFRQMVNLGWQKGHGQVEGVKSLNFREFRARIAHRSIPARAKIKR